MKLLPLGLVLSLAPAMAQQTSVASTSLGGGLSPASAYWKPSSVVLIVLDDIGTDQIACHPNSIADPPSTPTISALAAEGVQFTNAWGAPVCSPGRASLLTGRFPFRHGIGSVVLPNSPFELPTSEVTIAERVAARGYRTAFVGKWHLTLDPESPCDQGFETFVGSQGNIEYHDYWTWDRIDDTSTAPSTVTTSYEYNTTELTNEAIAWISAQKDPYFLWLAYHVAHEPIHCPPVTLQGECMDDDDDDMAKFRGMVESVDSEIARLLSVIDRSTTTVILVGDNGTNEEWTGAIGKSKGSVHRLGIEVPLIFWGAAVDGAGQWGLEDSGHANVADIYKTVLKLLPGWGDAGMQTTLLDSVSLYNSGNFGTSRAWNFAERYKPLGAPAGGPYTALDRAAEDSAGYKLIERETGARALYDTAVDPDEETDLLADGISPMEQAIVDSLDQILAGLGL